MKVLFISSGNKLNTISPIIKNQGNSLIKKCIEIEYFIIIGKGFFGYFKNIFKLRNHLKKNQYDLIHAHYSLSGICASFAVSFKTPLIVSLMGSDIQLSGILNLIVRYLAKKKWQRIIVKSKSMQDKIKIENSIIIPNGVDQKIFKPMDKIKAKKKLGWDLNKKHILFLADPQRKEKNYPLAEKSISQINNNNHILKPVFNIPFKKVNLYFNASDIILLTSLWEGSPNVIKEAMACNCPIVSTDVGDVKWVIEDTKGCYITSFNPEDVANKIKTGLKFNKRTEGRNRIIELGLNSESVAKKIKGIYEDLIKKK